jgi:hypothetical protein
VNGWENFAIAQVGASAALAGLVLVSVSVNLDRVLAEPSAPPRVAEALVALLALLVAATALLVPRQPLWLVGAELLGVGATACTTISVLQRRAARAYAANHPQPFTEKKRLLTASLIVLGQLASLSFAAAGALLLLGNDVGFYGVALGAVGSFGLAFLDAWTLLIEIHRSGTDG